jgi:fermentation-respiration switch protein FrsA (DUF1100 family)
MMARLKNKAAGPVTLYEIVGANHNDIYIVGGDTLLEKFGQFFEQVHQGAAIKNPDRVEVIKNR